MDILTDTLSDVRGLLEETRQRIVSRLSDENITVTGKTARSLRVVVEGDHVILKQDGQAGGAPIQTTEKGRRAGGIPMDFAGIIEQWSKDKGLTFESDRERRRFAGAVAFGKIRRYGFGRPSPSRFGRVNAVIYTPEIQEARDRIKKVVSLKIRQMIRTNITTE